MQPASNGNIIPLFVLVLYPELQIRAENLTPDTETITARIYLFQRPERLERQGRVDHDGLAAAGKVRALLAHGRVREGGAVRKVARWQNLIPSFPWFAPGWRALGRNPRKERDLILQRSVAEP